MSVCSSWPSAVSSPPRQVQLAFIGVKLLPLAFGFNRPSSGPSLPSHARTPAATFPPAHPGLSLAQTGLCPRDGTDASLSYIVALPLAIKGHERRRLFLFIN